jgi:hypothetical protein
MLPVAPDAAKAPFRVVDVAELMTATRNARPMADRPLLHQPHLLINLARIVKGVGVDRPWR